MRDRDPNIIYSSLGRVLSIDGVTVDVKISRLEDDPQWALEVVNEEGMRAFVDDDNVIPFPGGRRSVN